MLISLNWIKDFVQLPALSPQDLGVKFTLSTAEVEEVISTHLYLTMIRVVEIVTIDKHPEADKLNLVTFKISETETRRVVCGASNVRIGMRVPYAPLGVTLPNGLHLEAKKIRGILSEGMLCSEEELGLALQSEGLLDLGSSHLIGTPMSEVLNKTSDVLLNVDNKSLTHRPDLWGHYGMAREFATIFKNPLQQKFDEKWQNEMAQKINNNHQSPLKLQLDAQSGGLTYLGFSIDNIQVGESPRLIVERLTACGLRSINNIVDISNYVMLELGIPLHIFDRDKISGNQLSILKLESPTTFETLDLVSRALIPGDTVIADASGPLVLAGIMGGAKSGVSESTKNIFIEVANWDPAMIRRTSTRLGLRTDSSQRYEKTLDSQLLLRTLYRTIELIFAQNADARPMGFVEKVTRELDYVAKKIQTSPEKIQKVLGKNIPVNEIKNILTQLDFQVSDSFEVTIPSYRATKDVSVEADLIEEIGRIVGYDHIPAISPQEGIIPVGLTDLQKIKRRILDFMVYSDSTFEIMTYPLVGEDLNKSFLFESNALLKIKNSISNDRSMMRRSLIPSFLEAIQLNAKHSDRFKFFELGRIYSPEPKNFVKETHQMAAVHFHKTENTFLSVANMATQLLATLGIQYEMTEINQFVSEELIPKNWKGVHPYEARAIKAFGKIIGVIFSVHPIILKKQKIRGQASMLILDLSLFQTMGIKDKMKYKPLSKMQPSAFDWTVVASAEAPVEQILKSLSKLKLKELTNVDLIDIYPSEDKKLNYVTLKATLQSEGVSMTAEILKKIEDSLVECTEKAGFSLKK